MPPGKPKSRSNKTQKTSSASAVATVTISGGKTKSRESRAKARKVIGKVPAPASESESDADSEVDEDEDEDEGEGEGEEGEDDDGVDEEGMKKLMKALGEGGLDDVGQMQLDALEGGGTESNEDGSEDGGEDEDEDENGVDEDEDERGEEEQQIALEDAESVEDDAVLHQTILTNNKTALERIRDTIKLDSSLPWTETLTVTYPETIDVDVDDDLNRELAFYKQALHGATSARKLADAHKLPFTRPADYFAEMVKSDAHMERIRQRLLDEGASIKKSEDRRREREGKKFGKQVQIEKLKERERSKKEMEERLKGLKRKHKDVLDDAQGGGIGGGDDAFDIAVENAISDRPSKPKRSKNGPAPPQTLSRRGRDAKFGFGGKGRRDKQNTRESTEKFDFGSRKGAGGGQSAKKGGQPKRLGKSRRMASRGR